MADAKERIWRAKVGGKDYELVMHDITASVLRQMKGWYGREYGSFLGFITLLAQGDVDALSCALWLARRKAGERVPQDPSMVEFNVGDFEALTDDSETEDVEESEEVRPTERTPDSERTSTSSDDDTSLT